MSKAARMACFFVFIVVKGIKKELLFIDNNLNGLGSARELRTVGTLGGANAREVRARTINEVFCFYYVLSLRKTVEEIVCAVVLWSKIVAIAIATKLRHRLETCSTLIAELNEVVVAVGNDGDGDFHFVAHP